MGIFAPEDVELPDSDVDYEAWHAYVDLNAIEVFDNTMMNTYRTCPRLFYWSILRGFEPRRKSAALSFGSAWHDFLEHYLKSGDFEFALKSAINMFVAADISDQKRNITTLTTLAAKYDKQFSHNEWNVLGTEVYGTVMIGDFLYGAKIDAVVETGAGVKGVEHKTASMMKQRFFDMFRMSSQCRGYHFVLRNQIADAKGIILNVAHIVKEPDFFREDLRWSDAQIEDWLLGTMNTRRAMLQSADSNVWQQNSNSCFSMYGACPMLDLCMDPKHYKNVIPIKSDYQPRKWEPFAEQIAEAKEDAKGRN